MLTVLGLVALASLRGEVNWATTHLGWHGLLAYLVPAVLDGTGICCSLTALDRIDKGEAGLKWRILSVAFVGLGAWINWRNALSTGDITRELFFPVMTGGAYLMVHFLMGDAKQDARRRQHGHKSRERPEPLPRLGMLVWLPVVGMPREALRVSRDALELRMRRSLVAAGLTETGDETSAIEPGTGPEAERDDEVPVPVVQSHVTLSVEAVPSQSDAIREAIKQVQRQAPGREVSVRDVVKYLESHERPGVATQRVNTVMARDRLRLVGSQGGTEGDAGETGETLQVPGSETTDGAAAS
jgi:hypothetical protein